jgi:ABC-type transport system involved in multi-copper enzyme maturation permease subunit
MGSIFKFEIQYRLKRPATLIYALLFFTLGVIFMSTDAVRIGGGYGKVFSNAPYNIHQIIGIMGVMGLFVIMAFHAVPVFRDTEHKMDSFLYAYPISKVQYLAGRFWGTFFMCSLVFLFLPFGMMLGEWIARFKTDNPEDFGAFSVTTYLWPYIISTLPTVFLLGSLFFSLVSLTRKMMYAYLVAISFVVFYSISTNLLSELDNKFFASMLDPFGLIASDRVTEYWSIQEKNTRVVPLTGWLLYNRLFWLGVSGIFLGLCFSRFRMSPVSENQRKKVTEESQVKKAAPFPLPQIPQTHFNQGKMFLSLLLLEIRQTIRNVFFLAFLFAIALYMAMDAWYADSLYETGIHPVTGNMLETISSNMFNILSIVLIIFLAGEIVWRERQSKMEGIYDAFPVSNRVIFWSKFGALLTIPLFLLALVPMVAIPVQLLKGYTHLEPELYAKTLLLFELPRLWLIAALAFTIQQVMNNKYTANVAILLYYLSAIGLNYIHIEHPLFRYGSGLSYRYSDMNGFGDSIRQISAYLMHWTWVGLFLLALGYLFMVRGPESGFKARIATFSARLKESRLSALTVFLPLIVMLCTGFFITRTTLETDHYTNSQIQEKEQVAYEKKFSYLKRSAHPSLAEIHIGADMWPENGDLILSAKMVYKNMREKSLDTLWYNFQPEGKILKFQISQPCKLVYEDPKHAIRAYKLSKPLAPGDSFVADFRMSMAFTGFNNESPVKGNGTFFNNDYWPSMGFNGSLNLMDDDKRKEYGLPEVPPMASQLDSAALNRNFFDDLNHALRFEATLSTSPDQIAIAPGYLQKEWTQNGRRYFHYKMDRPISNFYSIISARYAAYKEKWKDVDITIYHHPWHAFNVKKMAEAVRHSLDYYTSNFGPYQHKQVRILEFPRYATFAQSFDNTIPYSEAIGFIANLKDEESIDYVYFVTAHEMAHQWWGHQILPASVRGAQFLSETMAEYSALMVMKKRYGDALMGRFLRRELNDYLGGRSSEKKKENPLLDIEMQGYAYYNKGSLAMFSVMDLIGEEKMNAFLTSFVSKYKFTERPYPSTHNFYTMLMPYLAQGQKNMVDDQLKRITLYKNKVEEAKGKKLPNGDYEVKMKFSLEKVYVDSLGGNEKIAPWSGPVYLGLLMDQNPKSAGDVLKLEKIVPGSGREFTFISKKKATYVGIDPLNTLTDIMPEDNRKPIDWE